MGTNERASTTADVAVIIGRWQILQRGHGGLLRAALAAAPKVVVVIGSAWRARDSRNPFTWQERQQQFEAVVTPEQLARMTFLPVRDYFDDERWGEAVRAGVARTASHADGVALVGFKKDHTSGYLDNFPGWSLLEVEPEFDISSTELREIYFELEDHATALTTIGNYVEPGVKAYLDAWAHLPAYRKCAAEYKAVAAYKKKYTAPFALTADCVLTAGGHVLLIRRGGTIGHGLWALPGGFVDPHERFYAAAVRELEEETGFRALPSQMKNALRGQEVFDHPLRSARGRIVTEAFHFDLGDTHLPEVRGSDDAKEARWVPIAELPAMEEQLFEDHATILDHFLGLWPRPSK
ncbi:MAG: NUDIX domain-containing protein [Gammaproteobacteria bacterium]